MMTLSTLTATAPSHWANALINGDWSEITSDEAIQINKFRDYLISGDPSGSIVSCEDAGFMWNHEATQFGALASDCQTYVALVDMERTA